MKILTEKELQKEAVRLLKNGRMPSLAELSRVVAEVSKEYAPKIRRARREARGASVSKSN